MIRIQLVLILLAFLQLQAKSQYDTLVFDGEERYYHTFFPSQYSSTQEFPMILALHGGIGNGEQLEGQSQLSVLGEEEGIVVVYPEGFKNMLGIRTWNGGVCCGTAVNNDVDDVGFLSELIEYMIENYSIDSDRIYVRGLSNGGYMTYRLACEIPHKIAGIAPIACSMARCY